MPVHIRRVSVHCSRTLSKQFCSDKCEVGLEADITPDEDEWAVYRELEAKCKGMMLDHFANLKKAPAPVSPVPPPPLVDVAAFKKP